MNKEEIIKKYGEEAYEKQLQQSREYYRTHLEAKKKTMREWRKTHPEEVREQNREWRENHLEEDADYKRLWRENNPEKVKANDHKSSHKKGEFYEKRNEYRMKGIPHEKDLVRGKHRRMWTPYKQIIAPDSELHHQWQAGTANYDGVALVEKEQHRYGIIDVIQTLEGKITLLTEEEIIRGGIV